MTATEYKDKPKTKGSMCGRSVSRDFLAGFIDIGLASQGIKVNVSGSRWYSLGVSPAIYREVEFKQLEATPEQAWRTLEGFFTTPCGEVPDSYVLFQRNDPDSPHDIAIRTGFSPSKTKGRLYHFFAEIEEIS